MTVHHSILGSTDSKAKKKKHTHSESIYEQEDSMHTVEILLIASTKFIFSNFVQQQHTNLFCCYWAEEKKQTRCERDITRFWQTFSQEMDISDNFLSFSAYLWTENSVSIQKPGPSSCLCSPGSVCSSKHTQDTRTELGRHEVNLRRPKFLGWTVAFYSKWSWEKKKVVGDVARCSF